MRGRVADAPHRRIEEIIRSTGFFRQKAKSIQGSRRRIVDDFGGKVPDNMDVLLTLPGAARKIANVVLGAAFGISADLVVDTHVGRLATRMALTFSSKNSKDAVKIERDLIGIFPRKERTLLGHALIWHGRRVCSARKPDCARRSLVKHCPSASTLIRGKSS